MSFRLLQWFICYGTVIFYLCNLHEPGQIDTIHIIHPLENLHCQTEWKRVDAVTRKRIEFIWNLWSNQYKVSRRLKPTLVWQTLLNTWKWKNKVATQGFFAWFKLPVQYYFRNQENSRVQQLYSYKIWKVCVYSGFLHVFSLSF